MNKKGQLTGKISAGIILIILGIYAIANPGVYPYAAMFGSLLIAAGFFLLASD